MTYITTGRLRVTGHTLLAEGAPFTETGVRVTWHGTFGDGHGRCSCGAMSPVLDSGTKRRRWHREHKQLVLDQLMEATLAAVDADGG